MGSYNHILVFKDRTTEMLVCSFEKYSVELVASIVVKMTVKNFIG